MTFLEYLERETQALKEFLHLDPMEPRTWECDPLLVIDSDGETAFVGKARVQATPHEDLTADLQCEVARDGWYLSLRTARIRSYNGSRTLYHGTSDGVVCHGQDAEGNAFVWYIDGAAAHVEWQGIRDPQTLLPEQAEA